MRELITFKGSRSGLQLFIDKTADFGDILEQLQDKLESAAHFFAAGTAVKLPQVEQNFTEGERTQLYSLLADYGLEIKAEEMAKASLEKCFNPQEALETEALLVTKTLRNGQLLKHPASIVIMGDVNPGAEVIAGGHIVVLGACRGLAHAGALGNREATITATKLLATQLRIADVIARAPDGAAKPDCTEIARIQDGQVVIEPVGK